MLNNPKAREMLAGVAVQANQKIRQQIEAFVASEIAKATTPLRSRITELEERVAALEGDHHRQPSRQQPPSRSDIDPGNI